MTSPIDAWNQRYALERVRLPGDIDELEVICCESSERMISHIGIEFLTCTFNNSALQGLRQRFGPNGKVSVRIRYNTSRLDRIWVEDPVSHERFEVLNRDPATKDLSAKQVGELQAVHRNMQLTGAIVQRAQARKRMEEKWAPLLAAKTMRERKRAHKMLGIIHGDAPPNAPVKPKNPARRSQGKSPVKATLAAPAGEASDRPRYADPLNSFKAAATQVNANEDPPMFKVVQNAVAFGIEESTDGLEPNANPN